jgi:hypothetical protein
MRLLGAPLYELPGRFRSLAESLLPLLVLAASGQASRALRAEVERVLLGIDHVVNRDRAEAWSRSLAQQIERSLYGFPTTEAEFVGWIDGMIEEVHEDVGMENLPREMRWERGTDDASRQRERTQRREYMERVRAAAGRLSNLRITLDKAGGRGKRVSPWGAAREIAACFGLVMPERQSEKRRDNTKAKRVGRRNRESKSAP